GLLADGRAAAAEKPGNLTILDLDWRPTLWPQPAEAPSLMAHAASLCEVLIGGDSEFEGAGLQRGIGTSGGPQMVVLKHGPAGVSLITAEGRHTIPGIETEVLCGIGAGDALTAAFAAGLLRGLDPLMAVARGN